ncbi:MAG: nucleotidyltransferase domain-containing protein [Boseongicola sp.]|nr:nucleotidyltransferase domain-containing protein [Boseongicola sp.]
MDDTSALAEIRRAVQKTLDAWPDARAAVLFGSRARGTHRPDSDWDIAFITVGDGDRLGKRPKGVTFSFPDVGQYVNDLVIPEELVARKALCIGHVGHGIARDGRVLAGHWVKPETKGRPFMEAERYGRLMRTSLDMVERAIDATSKIGLSDDWERALTKADDFVACTADAAEHLAKAMLGRHGITPEHSHAIDKLAGQARDAGLHDLGRDLLGLDGFTQSDHKTRYEGTDSSGHRHAIERLPNVVDLLKKEVASVPHSFINGEKRDSLIKTMVDVLAAGASDLRSAVERDGADMRPPHPHGWLKPLLDLRRTLPARLDDAAKDLGGRSAGTE